MIVYERVRRYPVTLICRCNRALVLSYFSHYKRGFEFRKEKCPGKKGYVCFFVILLETYKYVPTISFCLYISLATSIKNVLSIRSSFKYRVFIKYCVFFEYFKIFRTLAFLCFPSVSVCVHTPGR